MARREHFQALWESVPAGLQPPDFELRLEFLREHVHAGDRVLDIGCGEGWFASELLRMGASVVAADVASEPLRRARERDPRLRLQPIDAERPWPFPDASAEAVWAGEVIEHVADTAGWLSEARRVLAPGGRLLLSTPNHSRLLLLWLACSRRAFATHFDPLADHLRFYTRAGLTGLLAEFGFRQVSVSAVAGFPGARRLLLACAVRSRW
jgi:2-polyprenyl-3-methyl-5-hydroxy-6-metoxy-1,4-benzoquinol methylase